MRVSFAFSPCPNDTFMFEPLVNGRIDTEGLEFDVHLADVEALNKAALQSTYDITKLSFNAYTRLTEHYQLLNSGSALGNNCGPLLIAKPGFSLYESKKIKVAIPGVNTTANFLLSFAFPFIDEKKEYIFSEIEDAVQNREVDAGVIIHENRFTFQEKGLIEVKDLGAHWEESTNSPIPLGGIVTRRDFPLDIKQKIDRVVRRSVEFALANPESGKEYIRCHAQEMDDEVMQAHIKLYVNHYSSYIGKQGKSAVQYLFENHPDVNFDLKQVELFVPLDYEQEKEQASILTATYWSHRYKAEHTGWDVGTITTPIKEYIDQIEDKNVKVLIPGAGNSHEAEYLHKKGFKNVYVCDFARPALENFAARVPSFPKEHLICANFFDLDDSYDLILEQTFFCALNPNLRYQYVKQMKHLLRAGGKLVGLLFGIHFPFEGPPFGGSKEEYEGLLNGQLQIDTLELCHNSIPARAGNELFIIAHN